LYRRWKCKTFWTEYRHALPNISLLSPSVWKVILICYCHSRHLIVITFVWIYFFPLYYDLSPFSALLTVFYDAVSNSEYTVSNDRKRYVLWIEKDFKWTGYGLISVLSQHLPGRTVQNHKDIRIANDPAEIQTRHTSLEHYHYTNHLSVLWLWDTYITFSCSVIKYSSRISMLLWGSRFDTNYFSQEWWNYRLHIIHPVIFLYPQYCQKN
jgi:hypothetical protein